MIIVGATDTRAQAGFAPIAIGLGLTLIHLIAIPITNLSVKPARVSHRADAHSRQRKRRVSSESGR
jgi:glycerol uptake facilitator-like aquaporin